MEERVDVEDMDIAFACVLACVCVWEGTFVYVSGCACVCKRED